MTTPETETIKELTTLISKLTDDFLRISTICREAMAKTNQALERASKALETKTP